MRAKDDNFVRLLIASDLAHNVFLLHRFANLVGHVKVHSHFPWISGDGPRKLHRIFARHDCLRNLIDLAGKRIRMAIEQQPFPRAHP